MRGCIFIDLDGTLTRKDNPPRRNVLSLELLPGVKKALFEWHLKGYKIVITTARPETQKHKLKTELLSHGLFFDDIICDCGNGPRYLINDNECYAYQIACNGGFNAFRLEPETP